METTPKSAQLERIRANAWNNTIRELRQEAQAKDKNDMRNHAQFCNAEGETLIGTDSLILVDGRWNQATLDEVASKKRESFRVYLPHLYEVMTHYTYRGEVRSINPVRLPDTSFTR